MTKPRPNRDTIVIARSQRGSFLLEALISILIVAFGVLGLVGLQARVLQQVDDSQNRSEAVYLANAFIGQMWGTDKALLAANFDSGSAGPNYTEFKAIVAQRLPGALAAGPVVTVSPRTPPAPGTDVDIEISWNPPGENAIVHRFRTTAVIGKNS